MVENPPVEVTPDFTHETCKDHRGEVIGETKKVEEVGLGPCTFPGPRVERTPMVVYYEPRNREVQIRMLFIMNPEHESHRQDLYLSVGPMKD